MINQIKSSIQSCLARTGSPWCELPEKYGPWHTAYNNFKGLQAEIQQAGVQKPQLR